jgi:RNA polymerase sigma factor (sigma-70 family)
MSPDELALALEVKRSEMLRATEALMWRYNLPTADAEDFLQEAILRLLNMTEAITAGEMLGLYYTTIRNLLKNRVRDTQARSDDDKDVALLFYEQDSQAQMQHRERLNVEVTDAIQRLPERTRRAVELIWMEECTHLQAATTLKCSTRDTLAALESARPLLQAALTRYDHRRRLLSVPIEGDRGKISQPAHREASDKEPTYDVPVVRNPHHHQRAKPVTITRLDAEGRILSVRTMPARIFRQKARELTTSHVSLVPAPLSIPGPETSVGEMPAA